MKSKLILALVVAIFAGLFADLSNDAEARRRRRRRRRKKAKVVKVLKKIKKIAEKPTLPKKLPLHPEFGIPVFDGAKRASEKMIRGLALDAFDGYKVGLFLVNAGAKKIALFYMGQLGKTVKKKQGEMGLRYTMMIAKPSGDNPLGDKIVIHQRTDGIKDLAGNKFSTTIAVYRKMKPRAAAAAAPGADTAAQPGAAASAAN